MSVWAAPRLRPGAVARVRAQTLVRSGRRSLLSGQRCRLFDKAQAPTEHLEFGLIEELHATASSNSAEASAVGTDGDSATNMLTITDSSAPAATTGNLSAILRRVLAAGTASVDVVEPETQEARMEPVPFLQLEDKHSLARGEDVGAAGAVVGQERGPNVQCLAASHAARQSIDFLDTDVH